MINYSEIYLLQIEKLRQIYHVCYQQTVQQMWKNVFLKHWPVFYFLLTLSWLGKVRSLLNTLIQLMPFFCLVASEQNIVRSI